jgi:hypothetical protein
MARGPGLLNMFLAVVCIFIGIPLFILSFTLGKYSFIAVPVMIVLIFFISAALGGLWTRKCVNNKTVDKQNIFSPWGIRKCPSGYQPNGFN